MRLIYHPNAEAELTEAAQFYEARVSQLGGHFLEAADRALSLILQAPERWRLIEADVRRIFYAALSMLHLLPRADADNRDRTYAWLPLFYERHLQFAWWLISVSLDVKPRVHFAIRCRLLVSHERLRSAQGCRSAIHRHVA